ncbi:hypothetical protein Hdeb2414_s0002g00050101 [Helianthus debilis subsp. tardiflorus]
MNDNRTSDERKKATKSIGNPIGVFQNSKSAIFLTKSTCISELIECFEEELTAIEPIVSIKRLLGVPSLRIRSLRFGFSSIIIALFHQKQVTIPDVIERLFYFMCLVLWW